MAGMMQGGTMPMSGPHPPTMSMAMPPASQQPPSQQPHTSSADLVDPATKYKMLVPMLKDSLQKLMANAAAVFYQNAQFDSCQKPSSSAVQRFDKSLEEFYAICDQIELNLSLSLEVLAINADCQRNTPTNAQAAAMRFAAGGQAGGSQLADLQTYNQYQTTVKTQLTCAREVYEALLDCARKMGADRPGGTASTTSGP